MADSRARKTPKQVPRDEAKTPRRKSRRSSHSTLAKSPETSPPQKGGEAKSPKERSARLLAALEKAYPQATCELRFSTPHELLVATILSAQCTDVRVNMVTPALFAKFPTPKDYARATPREIEPLIRSCGFFRNKARAIHESMRDVVGRYGGRVPESMEELLTLRGVARKTANVVLGNAFHKNDGFVVDTHIERLSKRFGLVGAKDNVATIEKKLMSLFPRERWCDLSHMIIWHGRRACPARGGDCSHAICAEFGVACEFRGPASTRKGARVTET